MRLNSYARGLTITLNDKTYTRIDPTDLKCDPSKLSLIIDIKYLYVGTQLGNSTVIYHGNFCARLSILLCVYGIDILNVQCFQN